MSNNPNSEYQIPISESDTTSRVSVIVEEINVIYDTQQQPVDELISDIKKSPETLIDPNSARLYVIATELENARREYLKVA